MKSHHPVRSERRQGRPPKSRGPSSQDFKKHKQKAHHKQFLDDMFRVYKKLGGRKFIEAHVRSDSKFSERFLDKLTKIAEREIESITRIEMEVSGEVNHNMQFGFSPEAVAMALEEMKKLGANSFINELTQLPPPPTPAGDNLPFDSAPVIDVTPTEAKNNDRVTFEDI